MSKKSHKQTKPPGMIWIPGGSFQMGSESFYPEESPVIETYVEGFWIDRYTVTNADFRKFVKATSYRTTAEQVPDPASFPGVDPSLLVPGSLVFRKTSGPVALDDVSRWWEFVPGANWLHPEGPSSSIQGRMKYPVVQVSYLDALAYAEWAGKTLPSEQQWEYAARGGLQAAIYTWGNDFKPGGQHMANTWQGEFPWQNLAQDGYEGIAPIGSYPANGYGLYDMAGNTWEWTRDLFSWRRKEGQQPCCTPVNNRGHQLSKQQKVLKGGSFLCAPSYCLRYRPAARSAETLDSATNHISFRCIREQ